MTDNTESNVSEIIDNARYEVAEAKRQKQRYMVWARVVGVAEALWRETRRLEKERDDARADFDAALNRLGWAENEALPGTVDGLVSAIQAQVTTDARLLEQLQDEREALREVLMGMTSASTYTIDPNNLQQLLRVAGLIEADEREALEEGYIQKLEQADKLQRATQEAVQRRTEELAASRKNEIDQYQALVSAQQENGRLLAALPKRVANRITQIKKAK